MSRSQKDTFVHSEGDAWFERNSSPFDAASDPVLKAISALQIQPSTVLEIGCGRGDRLQALKERFGARCNGVEPSQKARNYAHIHYPDLQIERGTADALPYPAESFDLVVFGFCLYLCDPRDHFAIVCEANRVLTDPGFLVIYDFAARYPFLNQYKHLRGLHSYKMQWSDLFCSHPSYRLLSRHYHEHSKLFSFNIDEAVAVDVLRKSLPEAFPARDVIPAPRDQ